MYVAVDLPVMADLVPGHQDTVIIGRHDERDTHP